MSHIHTEGAGSSHRLSSEGRTSTAAFSTQGPTGPAAGTRPYILVQWSENICAPLELKNILTEPETCSVFEFTLKAEKHVLSRC